MVDRTMVLPVIHKTTAAAPPAIGAGKPEPEVNPEDEDIQVVPLDLGEVVGGRYKGWSKGKKNFTRVALKVLTDIYDKKSRELLNEGSATDNDTGMTSEEPRRLKKESPRTVPSQKAETLSTEGISHPQKADSPLTRRRSSSLNKDSVADRQRQKKKSSEEHVKDPAKIQPSKQSEEVEMTRSVPHRVSRRSFSQSSSMANHNDNKKTSFSQPPGVTSHSDSKKVSVTTKESAVRRKANLASVMGIVAFRKVYMSKLMALTTETKEEQLERVQREDMKNSPVVTDEDDILPVVPRFSAKLSPEAQFAMLKGYEDKLISDLRLAFPDRQKSMVRVKTPPFGRTICISPRRDFACRPTSRMKTSNAVKDGESLALVYDKHDRKEKEYQTQRKVSGQVETAIDILENLRGSSGFNIISPRLREGKPLEPVTTYNAWTHQWARQFKIGKGPFNN